MKWDSQRGLGEGAASLAAISAVPMDLLVSLGPLVVIRARMWEVGEQRDGEQQIGPHQAPLGLSVTSSDLGNFQREKHTASLPLPHLIYSRCHF